MGYQVAFDLYANDQQRFMLTLQNLLIDPVATHPSFQVESKPAEPVQEVVEKEEMEKEETDKEDDPVPMDVDDPPPNAIDPPSPIQTSDPPAAPMENEAELTEEDLQYSERLAKLKRILSGECPIELTLRFLYHFNK